MPACDVNAAIATVAERREQQRQQDAAEWAATDTLHRRADQLMSAAGHQPVTMPWFIDWMPLTLAMALSILYVSATSGWAGIEATNFWTVLLTIPIGFTGMFIGAGIFDRRHRKLETYDTRWSQALRMVEAGCDDETIVETLLRCDRDGLPLADIVDELVGGEHRP